MALYDKQTNQQARNTSNCCSGDSAKLAHLKEINDTICICLEPNASAYQVAKIENRQQALYWFLPLYCLNLI